MRRLNQDVLAGLMFLSFGVLALALGRDLEVGTSSQMGAGYFPTVLGALLIVLGIVIAGLGLRRSGVSFEGWSLRASVFVCAAFLLFAVAIEWVGLLLTAPACTLLASLGTAEFRPVQHSILAIVASLVAVAVFIWGLKIPIPMLPQL